MQRYQRHYGTCRQDVDAWHNSDVSIMRRLWSSTFWSCILILLHIVSRNSFETCSMSPLFRYTGTADYCSMGAVMSFQPMSPQVSRCSEEESLGALQDLRKTSTKAGHAHTIGIMLMHADSQWPMFICRVWNIWILMSTYYENLVNFENTSIWHLWGDQ